MWFKKNFFIFHLVSIRNHLHSSCTFWCTGRISGNLYMTDYLKSVKCILKHLVLLPARYTQYYHIEELGNTLTLGLNTVREIYRYIDLGLRVYFQTCRDFFWAFKKIWCYWKFKLQRYLNIERWGRYNCKNRNIFKNIFAKKNLFLLFLSNLNVNPNVFQNGKNLLF